MAALDGDELEIIEHQYVCKVLLSKSAKYFEDLLQAGLMTDKEASGFLEKLEHEMFLLLGTKELESEGLINAQDKIRKFDSGWELTPEAQNCLRDLHLDAVL